MQYPQSPKESNGLPRTGLTGGQEALWGVLVPELLEEQPMLLATEPSLRPHEAPTNFSLAVWKKVPPKALEPAFST